MPLAAWRSGTSTAAARCRTTCRESTSSTILTNAEKPCPACGELRERIGQEVSEQLEYLPASFKVLRHIRHKYGCRRCEHDGYNPQIAAAAKPAQPIDKGLPGPGLLAYRRHEQAGRPPAALPPGTHLFAAERPDRPQHDVRVACGRGRVGPAAGRRG